MYESLKQWATRSGGEPGFMGKVAIAGVAGAAGGFVGTPADMINVRMQNDVKLPAEKRRKLVSIYLFISTFSFLVDSSRILYYSLPIF